MTVYLVVNTLEGCEEHTGGIEICGAYSSRTNAEKRIRYLEYACGGWDLSIEEYLIDEYLDPRDHHQRAES